LWEEIEKSQAEQRARHQAEIADLTANFQTQLKVISIFPCREDKNNNHVSICFILKQQSLADLASNLSSSSILNSAEKPLSQSADNLAPKVCQFYLFFN
jgi:hypothetical protein